jgi:NADH-quinone oxidoreductase subunit N
MFYGFSFLYGFTGTLDFFSQAFAALLLDNPSTLLFVACMMALAGFLYKIAAAPLHLWSPDVYEAAPFPIIAFFSVVPKLAGIAILTRFSLALNAFGRSPFDWQFILSIVAILSITVGNFSALGQKNPKRLMAYSSIAQSGFLMVGIVDLILGFLILAQWPSSGLFILGLFVGIDLIFLGMNYIMGALVARKL